MLAVALFGAIMFGLGVLFARCAPPPAETEEDAS